MNKPAEQSVSVWSVARYLKQYLWPVIFAFIFLVAGRVFASFDPIWLKKLIDGVAANQPWEVLTAILVTYFLLNAGRFIADLLRDLVFAPAEQGISRTLSERLYEQLLRLPVSYHHDQKVGAVARKITRGTRAMSFVFDILMLRIIPTFVELIIVMILLLRLYSPIYALITVATVVIFTVFTVVGTDWRQKYRIASLKAEDDVSAAEVDTLNNIDTVKYFNNEPHLFSQYTPIIGGWFRHSVLSNRMFSVIESGQAIILTLGMGVILVLAVSQAVNGRLSIGDLVLLTTYIVRLTAPITTLGFVYRQMKDSFDDLRGVATILQEETTVPEPTEPVTIMQPKGEIVFENVSFGYEGKRQVLDNVSLTIKPGERVAFVGPSGVGKSTIIKLIFRFFDPTSGRILVDNVPLSALSKESRHDIFGIVPQEPALFNTTISENIRFGKPEATQQELEQAASLANAATFIDKLPDRYETVVGERGVKLSGGEKQRVAIARAIVRNPKVLAFDEATSSLDSHSEGAILDALHTVSEGRTTISVAHRLSTIADSDRIYVLKDGKISEQGTHAELLRKKGLYSKLWATQAKSRHEEESEPVDQDA